MRVSEARDAGAIAAPAACGMRSAIVEGAIAPSIPAGDIRSRGVTESCMPPCEGGGSRCKSLSRPPADRHGSVPPPRRERHFQFLRGRGQQCTPLVKETMPGRRRPEDRFPNKGRSCGRSSRVRVPGCEPGDPGAIPGGHPINQNRAQGKVVEPSVCKTELPGASPGCASIFRAHSCLGLLAHQPTSTIPLRRLGGRKPIRLSGGQEIAGALPVGPTISGLSFNSRTAHSHWADRGATPRGSTNLKDTFMSGHEEDSNPRRSDRRDTRGGTGVPDHSSNSAKA